MSNLIVLEVYEDYLLDDRQRRYRSSVFDIRCLYWFLQGAYVNSSASPVMGLMT